MKSTRKVPPLKLKEDLEREFYESSITFFGKPALREQTSSYRPEDLARLSRSDLSQRLPEVLMTIAILICVISFPFMIGMRGRFTPLKFEPPTIYGSSMQADETAQGK